MADGVYWILSRGMSKTKLTIAYFINWYSAHYGYDDTWREMVRQFYEAFGKEEDDVSGKHREV